MTQHTLTPLGAAGRGVLSGAVGTALMTATQMAYYSATGTESSSTPGEVGRRIISGVLQREAPEASSTALNQGMHWLYGSVWGLQYGIVAGSSPPRSLTRGAIGIGLTVWASSRAEMAAMQIAPPPWEDPPSSLAMDVGFHLVYGLGTALAFRILR
jgi:hypothetical protein